MEDEITHWLPLPAGAAYLTFGELPYAIASAICQVGEDDLDADLKVADLKVAAAALNIEEELKQAVQSGALQVLDPLTYGPHTFPYGNALERAQVRVSDLRRYLLETRRMGVRVIEPEPAAEPAPVADETPPLEDWKMRVQAEAAAHWVRLRKLGANPTRASIRPHLLKWCALNNILTASRINPSDGYLRTHVLSAKHWTPPD